MYARPVCLARVWLTVCGRGQIRATPGCEWWRKEIDLPSVTIETTSDLHSWIKVWIYITAWGLHSTSVMLASMRRSPRASTSIKWPPFSFDCFLRGSTKSVFARCSLSSLVVELCAYRDPVETQLYFLWLKVTTKFDSVPRLFWQSHPCHKKGRSSEPPRTGLLHRRTKITGLQIADRTVGTGAIARSQYELEDFTSQDLTRNFLQKQCAEKPEDLI